MKSTTHPSPGRPPQNPQAPGTSTRQVCPPFDGQRTPLPGVSDTPKVRRTAQLRRAFTPTPLPGGDGFRPTDPYVRRYWVAAIGPGAVADLLRLAAAAQSGRSLPMPIHLPVLLREGLVRRSGDTVGVAVTIPPLPRTLAERLPTRLRRELVSHHPYPSRSG